MRHWTRSLSLNTAGGLLALVLWSTTFGIARRLAEQVGPLTAGAAVYLCGGVLCLVLLWRSQAPGARLRNLSPKYLLGCGGLFTLYTALIYLAVGLAKDRVQLLEVALVNYLWPAATILLSLVLLQQRASLLLWPATALALAGVFLVMTQSTQVSWDSVINHLETNPAAFGFAFVAAVSWGLYSNLARRWAASNSGGAVAIFVPVTGLVLLGMRSVAGETSSWNLEAVVEAVALGAITSGSYGLWDRAVRKGNLLLVAACSYFTPLLSTIVSCLLLGVAPGPRLWTGCLLIVAGSMLSWRSVAAATTRELKRENAESPPPRPD